MKWSTEKWAADVLPKEVVTAKKFARKAIDSLHSATYPIHEINKKGFEGKRDFFIEFLTSTPLYSV